MDEQGVEIGPPGLEMGRGDVDLHVREVRHQAHGEDPGLEPGGRHTLALAQPLGFVEEPGTDLGVEPGQGQVQGQAGQGRGPLEERDQLAEFAHGLLHLA